MEGTYELTRGDQHVGVVQVSRQGLYLHFSCRCDLSGTEICKVLMRCGGQEENLGVLVPVEGRFGLEKKLPAKRLGQGTPEFCLVTRQEQSDFRFVPIYPEEPFAYLHRLENAFLARQDGHLGIVIRKHISEKTV